MSHFLFPEYAIAEQSVTSQQMWSTLICFHAFTDWIYTRTGFVLVSQQPLGDTSGCWTGPDMSRVSHISDTGVPAGTLGGDSGTETVQTGTRSFLLLETSQSKGKMKEKSGSWFSGNVQILCSIINQDE